MAAPLLPLVLSAKCVPWRGGDLSSQQADAEFRQVRGKVLERDRFCCRFCGFEQKPAGPKGNPKANFYQQVHHRDDDHNNNDLSNLVTACMHCHAVQHIGLYGSTHGASLVWIPELTQAELNHLQRAVMVAIRFRETMAATLTPDRVQAANDLADAARSIRGLLQARKVEAERRYHTHNPAAVANLMISSDFMPPDAYARRDRTFAGLRLLLSDRHLVDKEDRMPIIVDHWLTEGAYANLRPGSWAGLLRAA